MTEVPQDWCYQNNEKRMNTETAQRSTSTLRTNQKYSPTIGDINEHTFSIHCLRQLHRQTLVDFRRVLRGTLEKWIKGMTVRILIKKKTERERR